MTSCPTTKKIFPLHAHTVYSLLDGVSTIKDYVSYCQRNGIEACSCTDHGYVMGLYDLYKATAGTEVKGIAGVEAYLHPGEDYEFTGGKAFPYFHLTLWSSSPKGYNSLLALSNRSWEAGRVVGIAGGYKPRITWEDLYDNNEGIICGSGCVAGPIVKPYLRGEVKMANENANKLIDIFGDRLYMEVFPHQVDRNYYTKGVVQVQGPGRIKYTFLKTDIISTEFGDITAEEAMKQKAMHIYGSVTNRPQDFPFTSRNIEL